MLGKLNFCGLLFLLVLDPNHGQATLEQLFLELLLHIPLLEVAASEESLLASGACDMCAAIWCSNNTTCSNWPSYISEPCSNYKEQVCHLTKDQVRLVQNQNLGCCFTSWMQGMIYI